MAGRTRIVLRGVLIASMVAIAAGVQAKTLSVSSTADTVAVDGACTLREAVANINAGSAVNADCTGPAPYGTGDAITFSALTPPATITLGSPLTLNKAVQVIGQGPDTIILDGANGGFALINVSSAGSGHVDLYDLNFTRGGQTGMGGALLVQAGRDVTAYACRFTNNSVPAPSSGGAITVFAGGTLTVGASRFDQNSADGTGGAIMNYGTLTVDQSSFTANTQTNLVAGMGGGAIYSDTGTVLTITRSIFTGNDAKQQGGALVMNGAEGSISESTFGGNTASKAGGAMLLKAATGKVIGIQNSTLSGNSAGTTEWGGGIYASGETIDLRNVTVTGNQAMMGAGVFVILGTAVIRNSIVAGNTISGGGSDPDLIIWPGAFMTSGDYNLFGTCTTCSLGAHDQTGISPNLASLADNGGPTFGTPVLIGPTRTHLPNPGSLAINGGNPAGCLALGGAALTTDQRGLTRPYGGTACDVGAVEVQAAAAVATKLAFAQHPSNAAAGASITPAVTVQLQDSGSNPVAQGGVSVTLSLTTGTGTLSGTPTQATNSSGLATFAGLSVDLAGTKNLSAAAPSLTSATSNSFVISAGLPAHIAITGGGGQSAQVGTAFVAPLQATVTDALGNPVSGAAVTFTPPGSGASALLAGSPATTNAFGVASVTATANATTGSYQVTAAVGTLPSVALTLTNVTAAAASVPTLGGFGLLALSALLASAGVAFLTWRR